MVLPSPFKQLTGIASLNRKHLAPHDTIHTLIRSEDGSHGIFELSFGLPSAPGTDTFRVTGTDGTLIITKFNKLAEDPSKGEQRHIKVQIISTKDGKTEEMIEKSCGVQKELSNFAAHIKGHDDGLGSPVGALRDVAIIQAGLDSNGSTIDLERLLTGSE